MASGGPSGPSGHRGLPVVVRDGRPWHVVTVENDEGDFVEEFIPADEAGMQPGPADAPNAGAPGNGGGLRRDVTEAKVDAVVEVLGGADCAWGRNQIRNALKNEGGDPDRAIDRLLGQPPKPDPVPRPPRPPRERKPPTPRKPPPNGSRELAALMEPSDVHGAPVFVDVEGTMEGSSGVDVEMEPEAREAVKSEAEVVVDGGQALPRPAKPAKPARPAKVQQPNKATKEPQRAAARSPTPSSERSRSPSPPDSPPSTEYRPKAPAKNGKSAQEKPRRSERHRPPASDLSPSQNGQPAGVRGHRGEVATEWDGSPLVLADVAPTERIHIGDLRIPLASVPTQIKKHASAGLAYGNLSVVNDGTRDGALDIVATPASRPVPFDADGTGIHLHKAPALPRGRKRKADEVGEELAALLSDPDNCPVVSVALAGTPYQHRFGNGLGHHLLAAYKAGWVGLAASVCAAAKVEAHDAAKQKSKAKGKEKAAPGGSVPLPPLMDGSDDDGATEEGPDDGKEEGSFPYVLVLSVYLTERALRYGADPHTAADAFVDGPHPAADRSAFFLARTFAGASPAPKGVDAFVDGYMPDAPRKKGPGWNHSVRLGPQRVRGWLSVDPATDSYYTSARTYYNPHGDASVYDRAEAQALSLELDGLLEYVRPPANAAEAEAPEGIAATLLPFQKRALRWMLDRETELHPDGGRALHPLWWALKMGGHGAKGRMLYANESTGTLSLKRFHPAKCEPGGLLAEEMGLGKTVEVLSLVLAHPRDFSAPDPSRSFQLMRTVADPAARPVPVRGTLIVAPQSILGQWISETKKHSPDLKFLEFERRKWDAHYARSPRGTSERDAAAALFADADAVFASYETLTAELRRSGRARKSALLWVQWWRVVCDEAQQVADSNGTAAQMAGELWRVNGWVVTGTPISNALHDIHGLLTFLDSDPFASREVIKNSVMDPFTRRSPAGIQRLRGLLAKHTWRNTKEHVRHEFELPESSEERIELDLVPAERLFYKKQRQDTLDFLRAQLSVNDSLSLSSAVVAKMTMLRQCCDHPQLTGQYNASSAKTWDELKKRTLSYEEIMREILSKAEAELEQAELDHVNEVLLVGYATLQRERDDEAKDRGSDSGSDYSESEESEEEEPPPPKFSRAQLEDMYLSCLTVVDRNLTLCLERDRSAELMLAYFDAAKPALRKWLRAKWHTFAALRALDPKHPVLEVMGAEKETAEIEELLKETEFSKDEIENRYWLKIYKQVAMIRNEQEGLRRKRVNEVSKKRRRPLAAIEKTMEQMAQKVRTKQSEVNHVRGRMEAEIAKKRAQGGDGAGPSDAPAEDEPERAPAPSNAADGNACAVCFDTNIEEPCVTPCAHVFCFGCIRPVLDVTKECPLCRTRLTASDLRVAAPEKAEEDEGAPQEVLDVKGEYGSKITRIVADVQQRLARDPTTKFVIFSHWTKMLRLVATALEANGIGTADFTGPRDGRGDALTRIKEDPGTSVILVGMRSREGAAGLTLTCCNVCYIVEPAISPGLVDQAIGRINRIGQTRPTTVVHLIVKDSIESKIEALQKRKRMAAKRGGQQLAEAASSIAERAGKGKQSAGAVKFAGANQEREELLTEEVCFIFDVDVDELRKDSELQQEAIATVQQRVREMGGGRSRRRRIDWSDDELEIMEE